MAARPTHDVVVKAGEYTDHSNSAPCVCRGEKEQRRCGGCADGTEGAAFPGTHTKFKLGEHVRKTKGSRWSGKVVGFYSTALTQEGYAVESSYEVGSVQIYPVAALEKVVFEVHG